MTVNNENPNPSIALYSDVYGSLYKLCSSVLESGAVASTLDIANTNRLEHNNTTCTAYALDSCDYAVAESETRKMRLCAAARPRLAPSHTDRRHALSGRVLAWQSKCKRPETCVQSTWWTDLHTTVEKFTSRLLASANSWYTPIAIMSSSVRDNFST